MTARLLCTLLVCVATGCEAGITTIGTLTQDAAEADEISFEAESAQLSGGFRALSDPTASATHYLAPPDDIDSDDVPGEARARYAFAIERAGDYAIWGRIRSPGASTNRFWFQLDGGPFIKWRLSVGDIWYWHRFHDDAAYDDPLSFGLSAGDHELVIANCVPGVGLDRLYIGAGSEAPSGNDTQCNPPHSIELSGRCVPSCGSQSGNTCGASACAGRQLLTAYDCDVCCRDPAKM